MWSWKFKNFLLGKPKVLYIVLSEVSFVSFSPETNKSCCFAYKGFQAFDESLSPTPEYIHFIQKSLSTVLKSYRYPVDVYCSLPLCFFHHARLNLQGIGLLEFKRLFDQKDQVILNALPKTFKNINMHYQVLSASPSQGVSVNVLGMENDLIKSYLAIFKKCNANLVSLSCHTLDFIHLMQKKYAALITQKVLSIIFVEVLNDKVLIYLFLLKKSDIFFETSYVSRADQSFFKVIDEAAVSSHLNNQFWSAFIERFVVTFDPLLSFLLGKRDKIDQVIVCSSSLSLKSFAKLLSQYTQMTVSFHDEHTPKNEADVAYLKNMKFSNCWFLLSLMDRNTYSFQKSPVINFSPVALGLCERFVYQKFAQFLLLILVLLSIEFFVSFLSAQLLYSEAPSILTNYEVEKLHSKISNYKQENQLLHKKIKSLLKTGYQIDNELKLNFFKTLPLLIPKGLILEKIDFYADKLHVSGKTQARNSMHEFQSQLVKTFQFIKNIKLSDSRFDTEWHYFTLLINIRYDQNKRN